MWMRLVTDVVVGDFPANQQIHQGIEKWPLLYFISLFVFIIITACLFLPSLIKVYFKYAYCFQFTARRMVSSFGENKVIIPAIDVLTMSSQFLCKADPFSTCSHDVRLVQYISSKDR